VLDFVGLCDDEILLLSSGLKGWCCRCAFDDDCCFFVVFFLKMLFCWELADCWVLGFVLLMVFFPFSRN